ncbi:hypothetical protein ACIPJS_36945 [Streptomyces sp. NPDC086783]|uniref:hypothetical protein n=1 Tax=Streptomyces sp. NPDC086783 TaxID=3365758 RepID=UPI00381FA9A0
MSNQPYEPYEPPYEGYDPYQQAQQQPPAPQQSGWRGQQGYDEAQQSHQYTQQWEGQTWETQTQPHAAADTAYLPPQGYAEPSPYGTAGQPLPPEAPAGAWSDAGDPGERWNGGAPSDGRWTGAADPGAQWTGSDGPGYGSAGPGYGPAHQEPAPAAPVPPVGAAVPAAGEDAPGYGPPTVTGNPRVTDAQRARAEGRSPIIEPGMQPAALTALLGLLLAGGAAVGQYALAVPLVLLQAVTAAGWFRLNGMWPARQGIALAFAGALAADAALFAAGRENAPAAILGTLGVWVLLTLVLQLRSHADPDTRMYGLMATVVSAALAIVATGHLAAEPDAVTVGAASVAVAVLARALPLPTAASVVVALLAAAGAGIAVGGLTDLGTGGAFLGLGAGVCALIGHRVASYDYPSRFVHMTAGVALPLTAAAPAVYLLGRALGQ